MNDLDLLVAGAMVTMIAFAGAYINVRRRANLEPVTSHDSDAVPVASRPVDTKR
jgi:hypothetical protein